MVDQISFIVTDDKIFQAQFTDFQKPDHVALSEYHPSLLPMVGQALLLLQEQNGYQGFS